MTDARFLTTERRGAICLLTFGRPIDRNPLCEGTLAALLRSIDEAGHDSVVRAVVVAAEGPAFCAGHDLKELTRHRADPDGGEAYFFNIMMRCAEVMQAIVRCPKPVIAAVQGIATAAGCQLVATCDLAVASQRARFATPGVNIGLFCSTPMVALSRNVSRKAAMEMLLLGDMIDADKARDIGLVNRVVPHGEERTAAIALAEQIAAKSAVTVAIGKDAFYRQVELPLTEAYAAMAETMVRNMLAQDAAEGIDAFLAKRPATWLRHDQ